MSGCNWQKKKFSVAIGGSDNYDKIFRKSKCCNAPVKVEGKTTHYYVCQKCNKACDISGF